MGYEIKLIIGKAGHESDEHERSTERYEDGSGFKYKKDERGDYIKTGRKTHYFSVYAELDLCKWGYQEDAFNKLHSDTIAKAKLMSKERVYYFYGIDGNTEITEDRYEQPMWPVPIKDVLSALESSKGNERYRRCEWAIALLQSMSMDGEGIEVMFYGH